MPIEDENTVNEFEDREDEVLAIYLESAARRASITIESYIETRLLQGADAVLIEQELLADLNTGGRIFGEFRNSIKATAHGNMRRVSDIGNYTENGIEIDYTWVTVQDSRVCPDCRPRHGIEKKFAAWEVEGTPRSGWSICRQHCRCFLASSEGPAMPAEPVIRKRRKK